VKLNNKFLFLASVAADRSFGKLLNFFIKIFSEGIEKCGEREITALRLGVALNSVQ
jgi:hypothetical protein